MWHSVQACAAVDASASAAASSARWTAIAVLGAPALAAGLGAGLLVWLDDAAWPGAFLRWWVSDSFGMLTVLPIAFAVHGPAVRRLLQPRQLLEFAGWLVLLLAMVAASFWAFSRVFVLVALPLLAIAFRYGQLPASLSNLAAALSLVALGSLAQTGRLGKVPHDALSSLEWGLYSAAMVIGPLMVSVSAERRAPSACASAAASWRAIPSTSG